MKEKGIDGECRRALTGCTVECRGDVRCCCAWLIVGPFLGVARSGKFNGILARERAKTDGRKTRRTYKRRWPEKKERVPGRCKPGQQRQMRLAGIPWIAPRKSGTDSILFHRTGVQTYDPALMRERWRRAPCLAWASRARRAPLFLSSSEPPRLQR